MNKRDFLRTAGAGSLAMMFGPDLLERMASVPAAALAGDEAFWAAMRAKFKLTPDYINLENGFYCFQPEEVLDQFIKNVRVINLEASHYMRTRKDDDKLRVRARLAHMAGCSPDELIITRNTTESLDTVIAGIDWKPGDEAVMANQDYGAMLDMFKLQARRRGMMNRVVDIPMDPTSDDEVVQVYANALTPATRLLMIPHMVNITGQCCRSKHLRHGACTRRPGHGRRRARIRASRLSHSRSALRLLRRLAAQMARRRHSARGILYVKQEHIPALWPIFADESMAGTDIRKLNHTGTHPVHTDLTIEDAIAFHEAIGSARKEARLRYLQRYWTTRFEGCRRSY